MATIELLDALASRFSLTSDYQIARFLGITKQSINLYRKGARQLDDELAIRVAEYLELNPIEVLALVHAARSNCPAVKAVWEDMAKQIRTAAMCMIACTIFHSVPASASDENGQSGFYNSIYYAHLRKRLKFLLRRNNLKKTPLRAENTKTSHKTQEMTMDRVIASVY